MTDIDTGPASEGAQVRDMLRRRLLAALASGPGSPAQEGPATVAADDGGAAVIVPGPAGAQREPFPLLDLQQAYWIGRSTDVGWGRTACHAYLELDVVDLDVARVEQACDALVRRHPMLRTTIDTDGWQRVLDEVPPYRVEVRDATGQDAAETAERIRHEMSHQVLPADRWPLFQLRATRTSPHMTRLHISFDLLVADAVSLRILATELVRSYEHPGWEPAPVEVTFRDYVQHVEAARHEPEYQLALEHWRSTVAALPPSPALPLARTAGVGTRDTTRATFRRRETRIDPNTWERVRAMARERGVTAAAAALAAFAEVAALWSESPAFTLNLTTFDRPTLHPDLGRIVGPFTGTTLLGLDLRGREDFTTFAAAVHRDMWRSLEHRAVSGVTVLRELARQGEQRVMPVVFTYVQDDQGSDFRSQLATMGEVVFAISQTPQVLLDCQISESDGGAGVWWDVVEEAFAPGVVTEMFQAFTDLLGRLADADTWTCARPVPTPRTAVAARLATEHRADLPLASLPELVRRRATEQPKGTAVVDGERRIDYDELVTQARQLAHRLAAAGVREGDLVGVWVDRGLEQVVALLGVVMAGAAYLPLDPVLPAERVTQLATLGELRHIVTGSDQQPTPSWPAGTSLSPAVQPAPESRAGSHPAPGATGEHCPRLEDLAYVIFTSGSTGTPKGVCMAHGPVANTLLDINERFEVGPQDRVLALSSIGFDLSVWDVFGVLAAGGTVVTTEPGLAAKDPSLWLARLVEQRVTVWNSAPALMRMLLDLPEISGVQLPDLRLVMLSGDWIPVDLPERIRRVAPGARVISLGGATEAAIWSVAHEIGELDPEWTSIPYGRPLTNQYLQVLDSAAREQPIGVIGELYIGGAGLADGYWQAAEATAAAFVERPGAGRWYRTGDHVRRHADGTLEFLGRTDGQVKVQGHRIELGEVDAALLRLPGVRAAVTEAVGPRDGRRQLVGYVVPADSSLTASGIRHELVRVLPAYMVPSQVRLVDSLPVNANGKIDRARLRLVDPEAVGADDAPSTAASAGTPVVQAAFADPASPLMQHLVTVVGDHLGQVALGPDDDLLSLGVDSIDMVRLAGVLERDLGFRPALGDLLRRPTVGHLRELLETDLLRRFRAGQRLRADGEEAVRGVGSVLDPEDRARVRREARSRPDPGPGALRRQLPAVAVGRPGARLTTGAVTADEVERICAGLVEQRTGDEPDRGYLTPGGLAAVQVHVWIRPDRVTGLPAGLYVVDPSAGELVLLDPARDVDPDVFDPLVYQGSFRQASFAVFLTGDPAPYRALYGQAGDRFAAVEAGGMGQLLRSAATELGLAVRGVPLVDSPRLALRPWVGEKHQVLLVLLVARAGEPGGATPARDQHPDYEEGWL